MASRDKADRKPKTRNPWGHYRKPPSLDQFAETFERKGDVPVLKNFLQGTATWVFENFAAVELEVHQAATIGQAAKQGNRMPDYAIVKKHCPRLAIIATEAELKEIVEPPQGDPKIKDLTAEIFARVLRRSKESIKKWAQRKK